MTAQPIEVGPRTWTLRSELLALGLLLLAHLAVNLSTATLYPSVWVDEAQFADAALNWVGGRGWTSTVWIAQTTDAFWAGNAPLFSTLLAGWLWLQDGHDIVAVRSLNPVLLAIAVPLAWDAVRRTGWLPTAPQRLLFAALLLTGHSVAFGMRWVRYDTLALLMSAWTLWTWIVFRGRTRLVALVVCGAWMPAAGLQLAPAVLVTLVIVCAFVRPRPWREAAALASGLVLGAGLLAAWFAAHGVLGGFIASVRGVGVIGQSPLAKLLDMPRVLMADKSLLLLFIASLVAAALAAAARMVGRAGPGGRALPTALPSSSPIALPVALVLPAALALGVPTALQLAGKFPVYYAWMAYLPAFVLLSRLSGEFAPRRAGLRSLARVLPWILAALACLPGLPLRLVAAWSAGQAEEAASLNALLWPRLRPGEHVLTDFKAYHAVRAASAVPYGEPALPMLRAAERNSIVWLVAEPAQARAWQTELGGNWRLCGSWTPPETPATWPRRFVLELREQHYGLALWRRDEAGRKLADCGPD